jgi:hypothetical protein
MNGIGATAITPKIIHQNRNFLRFILLATDAPTVAETTVETRKMMDPILDQKSLVNPVKMSPKCR